MTTETVLHVLKVFASDGSLLRRFSLAPGEHVLGSAAGADLLVEVSGISRRHAGLRVLADGGVVVTDLGSKNGTWVDGRRIRETAVCGSAALAFGSVQAALYPEGGSRDQFLLEPPKSGERERAPVPGPLAGKTAGRAPSTAGLHPVERLAESLEEVLLPRIEDGATPAEAAAALVQRWIEVLPVARVEVLRSCDRGEVVVAAASTAHQAPRAITSLEVEGPGGWKVRLRALGPVPLAPWTPLLRLAVGLLAVWPGYGPGAVRRSAGPPACSRPRREGEALPPPGLGAGMTRIYRQAAKVARGEVPVLVLGESGAGKEVLARWIHVRSRRAGGPFLAVNCAALPRELLEAELFGIERGVATGVEARPGILERAGGGTVFLDEVGDMAPETQAKVLRVLESTSLYRVGGRNPVEIDVRFVAATNRDLEVLVEEGGFRRDLYHRLAGFQVKLPPLRERREEIPSLAACFFHRELEKNGVASPGITRAALGALIRHPWPGNIRELQNEIAKATLLLEPGEPLDLQHLSERIRRSSGATPETSLPTLEETVLRAEREAFAMALAAAGGDAARAMELLGVSRTTYYRKVKELGLGDPHPPGPPLPSALPAPGRGGRAALPSSPSPGWA
ncbi:MAG TPA: sigma 54-interacting transcriptional regulator [Thermoanaerobaculia bacterium]